MEEDQDLRFVCKLCNKKYPCGKSLGGHMRSHVVANSGESDEKGEINMIRDSKFVDFANGQSSYTLRENPKKTWRAVDSRIPLPLERVCKQCGKGFQSLKALCGHMACHSEKDKGLKDDHSWTSESHKLVLDSNSDTEEGEEIRLRTRSSKRYKNVVLMKSSSFSLANNGSSSVSEIDGQEQEEVAMCLMLLSRDSVNCGFNSVVESSDNNSVVLETKSSSIDMRIGEKEGLNLLHNQETKKIEDMKLKGSVLDGEIAQIENSDSGYFLDECAKAESDVSVDGSRRVFAFGEKLKKYRTEFRKFLKENVYDDDDGDDIMASNFGGIESRKRKYSTTSEVFDENSQKRSKYECFNCKKTFKSYQALGGHRPCHKRTNALYESRYESGENVVEDSTDFRTNSKLVESRKANAKNLSADKKIKPKKHICPFCNRVFKNGQALGGHKRSHFINGNGESSNQRSVIRPVTKPDAPDLLDLNLPAPEADEDDGFFS
ncbi:hypothetical protein BUALT_Bualt17G0079300 [Buddleja alternifolia]|uniref:C2H2-type domain-containing protein n=1 Tax=Buddleja alternifolia TaxID=168488 RepID=A0AAV6W6X0_9LAMI|nr:hypothetical protein BUALT_Bualt17G0079300 [Buddleja alternifolia]